MELIRYMVMRFPFLLCLCALLWAMYPPGPPWGFFGHKKINEHAVYSLPPQMLVFFKPHRDYLIEHAIDPDMRRYASDFEGPRHYIDLDRYGQPPFPTLPRNWTDALLCHAGFFGLLPSGDTLPLFDSPIVNAWLDSNSSIALSPAFADSTATIGYPSMRQFFKEKLLPQYYESAWIIDPDDLRQLVGLPLSRLQAAWAIDTFTQHGVVPYHLERQTAMLTSAFRQGDPERILRLAADLGHYLADAHVPLHTTANYNGQLTNQLGIHAFWESRLPELYADETYDLWVGKATYIEDKTAFFWNIVTESYALVDSVLSVEKSLSEQWPPDRRFCVEWRNGVQVSQFCEAYARAYHERLGGMVERRMRQAILAVSSIWFTAWIDAGRPDLSSLPGALPPLLPPPPDTLPAVHGTDKVRPHEN
ncbi:MAG: hypothetical protein KatS3mg029_0109 [Saprospiraceae bacterium]|nr:MAG: hypothetical protein KatS3mg029_0109 [Saprospiraceae bacterium]